MKRLFFLLILAALAGVLLLFSPLKRLLVRFQIMDYESAGNEIIGDGSALSEMKAFIEDTYVNYSPWYRQIVEKQQMAEFALNIPLSDALLSMEKRDEQENGNEESRITDFSVRFINATSTHRNYLFALKLQNGEEVRFLDRVIALPEEEKARRLENSIVNLKRIFSYRTDQVRYYLYSGSRLQDMPYFSALLASEESSHDDLQHLFDSMPSTVRCGLLRFEDAADRAEKIYLTDHHWTGKGYDCGYRDILSMMAEDCPDVGDPKKAQIVTIPGTFYGSFSRLSNYYGISDCISYAEYGLESLYEAFGSGMKQADAARYFMEHPEAGAGYEAFFPGFYRLHYPDSHTGRNLLILGDSFARCIAEPLSSHFDTTYVFYQGAGVDLGRYYDRFGIMDVLITTHAHADHFDIDSVPSLMRNGKTMLFASESCREYVTAFEIDEKRVRYQAPGDRASACGFEMEFLPCDHGTAAPDAFGVLIRADGVLIAETGDTCLRPDYVTEYRKMGTPDVLIGPINGRYGNMSEEDFALMASAVMPELAIPCHYGMFPLHGGDPGRFYRLMKERCPRQRFNILALGEQVTF